MRVGPWVAEENRADSALLLDYFPTTRQVGRWWWADGRHSWSVSTTQGWGTGIRRKVETCRRDGVGEWHSLDHTFFEVDAVGFAEVDQRRHRDGPNLHHQPLRLPGRLRRSERHPLGGGWVHLAFVGDFHWDTEAGSETFPNPPFPNPPFPNPPSPNPLPGIRSGRANPRFPGLLLAAEEEGQTYVQILALGIGEIALSGPNGLIRTLDALRPTAWGFPLAEDPPDPLPDLPVGGSQQQPRTSLR